MACFRAEKQQLAREMRRAFGGFLDLRGEIKLRREMFSFRLQQRRLELDDGQDIVESCANPPANWPNAIHLCDCRSCASNLRCSVISRWMATKFRDFSLLIPERRDLPF